MDRGSIMENLLVMEKIHDMQLERDEMMEKVANMNKVLKAIDSRVKHHEFVNRQLDACLAILEADLKKKKKAREEATAEREKQLLE